jgi:predicted nucleic acid-binding protein
MSIDRHLVDTNVLVYALFPAAPQHANSRALVEAAQDPNAGLCVLPQILAEFFSVVTNPKRVTPNKTAGEALQAIESFLALPGLAVLSIPPDVVTRWAALVHARPVTGAEVFDVQAVAAMMAHGIAGVYTYNLTDFHGYPGIQPKEPSARPSPLPATPADP